MERAGTQFSQLAAAWMEPSSINTAAPTAKRL
jgi:hypothetical protein